MDTSTDGCSIHGVDNSLKNEDQERVHRYIRENPKLAWRAVKAVELGDAQELGRVMTEAQASL